MKQKTSEIENKTAWENYPGLDEKIQKCLREHNHFWWGCVLGLQYGKINTIRVNEKEEAHGNEFVPIVRIKYNSPYDKLIESKIIKFYPKPKKIKAE